VRLLHAGHDHRRGRALDGHPQPTREETRRAISGNLCRCTGYAMIVDAVQAAAQDLREAKKRGAQ
jgi:carbon-monoxide dehydrogenase small subunit